MAGTITVTGLSASEPAGERIFGPWSIQGTQAIGETLAVLLAEGDNTFAVPVGAVACVILGPVNGTSLLKVRTSANSADAGLPINGAGMPFVYPFSSAPGSLTIHSSAAQSTPLTILFI